MRPYKTSQHGGLTRVVFVVPLNSRSSRQQLIRALCPCALSLLYPPPVTQAIASSHAWAAMYSALLDQLGVTAAPWLGTADSGGLEKAIDPSLVS